MDAPVHDLDDLTRLAPADHTEMLETVAGHGPLSVARWHRAPARRDALAVLVEPDRHASAL